MKNIKYVIKTKIAYKKDDEFAPIRTVYAVKTKTVRPALMKAMRDVEANCKQLQAEGGYIRFGYIRITREEVYPDIKIQKEWTSKKEFREDVFKTPKIGDEKFKCQAYVVSEGKRKKLGEIESNEFSTKSLTEVARTAIKTGWIGDKSPKFIMEIQTPDGFRLKTNGFVTNNVLGRFSKKS